MIYKSMRSFAGGIIVAASMCGAVYYFGPSSEAESAQTVEKPSIDEMKSTLVSEGYVIYSEEEWNEQEAAAQAAKESVKDEAKDKPKDESEKVKEKIIYRTIITVTPGMNNVDVGKALEGANIIDSSMKFVNEVEKMGLEMKLRPGTFEVESGKSMKEVIEIIFK